MATIQHVATCRQTVEALLAPHHRLAADGYDSARSHLSKRKDAEKKGTRKG